MILTLIAVFLLVVSIILYRKGMYGSFPEWVGWAAIPFMAIGCVACLFLFAVILSANIDADLTVRDLTIRKETIEYRLSRQDELSPDNLIVNGGTYNDAFEFNEEIREAEKYEDNPWTSWFYPQGVKDIGQIDLDQYMK